MEEVGKGGCGTVVKVMDTSTAAVYAMKLVRLEVDDKIRSQIMMELKVLHKCRHAPDIVDFYGAFFVDFEIKIVMEYMDRGSVLDIYRAYGPLPEGFAVRVAQASVSALSFLRSLDIMHRDVKPANILVNSNGNIKLCDMGVSGALNNSLAQTYVGTTTYMSPERIQSQGAPYSIKADIWSLGLSLAEIVLGRYPYPLAPYGSVPDPDNTPLLTVWDALKLIVREEETPVASISGPDTPFSRPFIALVASCLQKEPSNRATLPDLADALSSDSFSPFSVADFLDPEATTLSPSDPVPPYASSSTSSSIAPSS